jgi:hypothetical protein
MQNHKERVWVFFVVPATNWKMAFWCFSFSTLFPHRRHVIWVLSQEGSSLMMTSFYHHRVCNHNAQIPITVSVRFALICQSSMHTAFAQKGNKKM